MNSDKITQNNVDLLEADYQFLLGLYRCAVSLYQPKIEKKAGIKLGDIRIRDYRLHDEDVMSDIEQIKHSWFDRIFRRSHIESKVAKSHNYLRSTFRERSNACMASYYRNTIYISFAPGIQCHEEGVAFATVHELAHALWEKLAGQPLDEERQNAGADGNKFQLLTEGFACYAEVIWFLDAYPQSVLESVKYAEPQPGTTHYHGMHRILGLVKKYGEDVLLEIPKRWKSF